jgi:hypothetical protein
MVVDRITKLTHKRQKRIQSFAQGVLNSLIKENQLSIKKLIFLFIIAFFINQTSAIGQKNTKEQTKTATVEPVLIWEKTFDEPIVDIIFDEATMTVKEARALGVRGLEQRKIREVVKVHYPRILVTEKAVKFLDKKGKIKKKYELMKSENLKIAENGRYICITKPTKFVEEFTLGEVILLDAAGNKICEIRDVNIYGYGDNLRLPTAGKWVLIDAHLYDDGAIELYDKEGRKKKIEVCKAEDEVAGMGEFSFTKDGKYFVTTAMSGGSVWDNSYLLLYDENGNEIWRKILKNAVDYFYDSITISPMGRYISVIFRIATKEKFEDYLELFDNKGNLLWKKQVIPGEYYLKFSKNEKYIVANNTNNNLYLFDVKSGELLWEYQDSALRTWSKNPCDITNKGDVLVETYYPGKKKIILFNKSGQVLWSKDSIR